MTAYLQTRGAYHAPTIAAMRDWVADCEWDDDTTHLTDAQIVAGVARHYAGGLTGFVADSRICPWCADLDDDDDEPNTDDLCRTHLAEYEGLPVDALDRRDAVEAAELADMGY